MSGWGPKMKIPYMGEVQLCGYFLELYIEGSNSQYGQLPHGLIAQFVEHCTGIAEVMSSNPVQA